MPPKSCKIVVALGDECTAGTVTGSTTTATTYKSLGNTTTTTRMTVTINNVMPQGIEITVEREVGNNIRNTGNVGIEMSEAAEEAGGMAVQSSARMAGPVDVSAKIASQQMKRAVINRTYQSREHVKERDAENKRNTRHSTKTAQQAGPVDVSAKIASQQMKCAVINRTYQSREHVKERDAENKRNTCHSTKTARQVGPVDVSARTVSSQKIKRVKINCTYQSKEHVKERHAKT